MDTSSFLARLESLLGGLPEAERQYAIAYYTEYLMDAGPEGADAAVAALGSPESLAAQIKADVAMRGLGGASQAGFGFESAGLPSSTHVSEASAFTNSEVPVTDTRSDAPDWEAAGTYSPPPVTPPPVSSGAAAGPGAYPQPNVTEKKTNSALNAILIVLLAIFALPIGIPVAAAVISLVIALFASVGSFIIAVLAAGLALLVGGIASIVLGFVLLFSSWATGLFYIGIGLLVLSLALLFNLGMFYLCRLIFKGIALLFNAIRKKVSKTPEATVQEVNHA
ncbi:MAG: hypothetical protein LBG68_02120 [Coriobacteriales bacterium]|jgi:uncharacterized membrane protein|nr:hypothetical protein [Coriobacteriales bacterium]